MEKTLNQILEELQKINNKLSSLERGQEELSQMIDATGDLVRYCNTMKEHQLYPVMYTQEELDMILGIDDKEVEEADISDWD